MEFEGALNPRPYTYKSMYANKWAWQSTDEIETGSYQRCTGNSGFKNGGRSEGKAVMSNHSNPKVEWHSKSV